MRRPRSKHLPFALGLIVLGLGAACLALCASIEAPSVGLSALAAPELVLMSCDRELGASAYSMLGTAANGENPEPLWCENPDSPHCLPGEPAPTRHDPWLAPLAGPLSGLRFIAGSRVAHARSGWPQPHATALRSYARKQRLERPPRAV